MINIYEILKHAPIGTKLYSPLFGEVMLAERYDGDDYSIDVFIATDKDDRRSFTKYGCYYKEYNDAECILFPSKENRDWSKVSFISDDTPIWIIKPIGLDSQYVFGYYGDIKNKEPFDFIWNIFDGKPPYPYKPKVPPTPKKNYTPPKFC